jgi:ABC-type glycerol-3-phosphate transport system substrate-binding protein
MDTRILILGLIVAGAVLAGCTGGNTGTSSTGTQSSAYANLEKAPLSTQSIADAVAKEGPVVILFFWFPQGAPCQAQEAILQDMKAQMGDAIEIVHISTTNPADAPAWNQYGRWVRGPPTTVILNDQGYIIDRYMGVASQEALTNSIIKARNS